VNLLLRQRLILRISGAISKEKRRTEGWRDKLAAYKEDRRIVLQYPGRSGLWYIIPECVNE
jgi:hypothetical protein